MKEREGELLVVEIPLEMMMKRFLHQRISNSRPHQLEAELLRYTMCTTHINLKSNKIL